MAPADDGVSALDAALPEAFARSIFGVPNILAALLIVVVGTVLSRFFARSVLIGAVNLRLELARPLSLGIKWLVMLLAWTIALEHLGIGRGILAVSFAILRRHRARLGTRGGAGIDRVGARCRRKTTRPHRRSARRSPARLSDGRSGPMAMSAAGGTGCR